MSDLAELLIPYTAADFARDVSRIGIRATGELNSLAQGMWNPAYCARDATHDAAAFCADLCSLVAHIEARAKFAQPAPADVGSASLTRDA